MTASPFGAYLAQAQRAVDARLAALLREGEPDLAEALAPALAGGKRLRPALLLLVHDTLHGMRQERALDWAAAVELVHAATLVHDDVVDGDGLRRGAPALHARVGPAAAVLAGDAALAWGLTLLQHPLALESARDALREAWRGAWREARGAPPQEVAAAKTARLFGWACTLGALCADAAHQVPEARGYGEALGMAYQAADDVADGDRPPGARADAEGAAMAAASLALRFPPGVHRDALADAPRHIIARALPGEAFEEVRF